MSEAALNPGSEARVLVVEDESAICELLSDMLETEGFKAHCVQTDRGAYDALQHDRSYACMIVDVNLGSGTTGYDVARFARQIDPALPVIFVSGQTSPASFKANSVAGSLFLAKPFTAAELLERVRMLVGDNDD
ncbi:response regulator [Phenylobacterium sp.]|uniref:response regulator n=1 Tax=Phenylobacterium sp. TaxID=1871053 RepID=UPI002DEF2F8C|nr:response regulator [Phenylobacterium sp.]